MHSGFDPAIEDINTLTFGAPQVFTGDACIGHHSGTDFFYRHYRSLCDKSHGCPQRQDISPRDFKGYVAHVVLSEIERLAPIRLRIRLIGSHVAAAYGEVTGQLVDEFASPEVGRRINTHSQMCADKNTPVLTVTTGLGARQEPLISRACYFPLFNHQGTACMIMTAVFVDRLTAARHIAMSTPHTAKAGI